MPGTGKYYTEAYRRWNVADLERRGRAVPALLRLPWPDAPEPAPDREVEVEADAVAVHEYFGSMEVGYHSAGSDVDCVRQVDVDERDLEDLVALGVLDELARGAAVEFRRDAAGRISEVMYLEETVS